MKRVLLITIAFIMLMLMLVGCADGEHEDDLTDIAGEISSRNDVEEYDLTIVSYMGNYGEDLLTVFNEYEKQHGLKIRTIEIDEGNVQGLNTKLMAKDTDIDIYLSVTLPLYSYIKSGYFVDLGQYESLKTRIESNNYTKAACNYGGEYFGLSVSPSTPGRAGVLNQYLIENLNLVKGTYTDPDGEKFYSVLKYWYDTSNGDFNEKEYVSIADDYLIISPYSKNKENAVLLLEMIFDHLNSDLAPYEWIDPNGDIVLFERCYPNIQELEEVYLHFTYNNVADVTKPFSEALSAAKESDGSDEALRKLAKDAAREVRQRLEG